MITSKHKIPMMLVVICLISVLANFMIFGKLDVLGFAYVLILEVLVISLVPNTSLHRVTVGSVEKSRKFKAWNVAMLLFVLLVIVAGMSANPLWDGHTRGQLNQYEELSESLAQGHLYIDHGDIDPKLFTLSDPYDKNARDAVHAEIMWDHSFFNGHYYMYFGVIPCLVFFLPFLIVTGHVLPTVDGTMFISFLAVLGLFMLFRAFSEKCLSKMSVGAYFAGFLGLVSLSIWWVVKAPSLYCTAIVSGVCFAVWGFYFIYKSLVVGNASSKSFWVYLVLGALLSAFTFGCRPPIGLFFVVYIPILVRFVLRNGLKTNLKVLICFFIPFIIVALGLMWYNYVRFLNPLEFGQTYQLTVTDQSSYEHKGFSVNNFIEFIRYEFLYIRPVTGKFPFINISGPFLYIPVVVLGLILGASRKVYKSIRKSGMELVLGMMLLSVFLIVALQSVWSPIPLPRYTMDFNFIIAMILMILIGYRLEDSENWQKINLLIFYISLIIIVVSVLFYFGNFDNPLQEGNPALFKAIKDTVMLNFIS